MSVHALCSVLTSRCGFQWDWNLGFLFGRFYRIWEQGGVARWMSDARLIRLTAALPPSPPARNLETLSLRGGHRTSPSPVPVFIEGHWALLSKKKPPSPEVQSYNVTPTL